MISKGNYISDKTTNKRLQYLAVLLSYLC